jgi:1,4-dihydroxy-2-naphthoate polyprenyltransferase
MRVLLILGHPRSASLGGDLARSYVEGAKRSGVEIRELRLADLAFSPDVTCFFPILQCQEPDLSGARRLVLWSEHLVFVYPTWWGGAPARLKGFLDRLLLPGFAFFEENGRFFPLLEGRTAEIITTMDTPAWVYRWIYGAPGHRALARATLGFCGIETVRVTSFGPVHTSSPADRVGWMATARRLGLRLGRGPRTRSQEIRRTLGNWLRALRLHFYPVTVVGYLVGSLGASRTDGFHTGAFWLGLIVIVSVKAATVLTNEIFDRETDARNRHWGPFTGGSRTLVEGRLGPKAIWRAARAALLVALPAGVGLVALSPGSPLVLGSVMLVMAVLAVGYTLPPLKLSHRGLGELDVAVTHSVGVVLLGYVAQGGVWSDPFPWLVSLIMGLAVFPAIILAGFPDRSADAAAGKRTLVVRMGPRRAASLALASMALAALASAISLTWSPVAPATRGLALFAVPHALLVALVLTRYVQAGAPEERIDGLLGASLLFILWFVALPAINLV